MRTRSGWKLEVTTTSSECAIAVLHEHFAAHGLRDVVVSDNVTAFARDQFKGFMKRNHIRHARTTPYHPSSNGQAERYVQTTKENLERLSDNNWLVNIARFLVGQHVTSPITTGKSLAELLMVRKSNTALNKLQPALEADKKEKAGLGKRNATRHFEPDGEVYVRAKFERITGPMSYTVNRYYIGTGAYLREG